MALFLPHDTIGKGTEAGRKMTDNLVLQGPLVLPDRILLDGEIVVQGERIQAVHDRLTTAHPHIRWTDGWIFPGLTDIHVHGIDGHDVMDGTVRALEGLDQGLAETGTTSYLATTMTATSDELQRVFEALRSFRVQHPEAGLLGVHMEGPYIHPTRIGAQRPDAVRPPSRLELEQYRIWLEGDLRRVTLAPESTGVDEVIRWARDSGIYLSAGHSNASFEEAMEAFAAGIRQVTHLFNAMTGLNHRAPGLVGAALAHPEVQVEVIADGVHLHPEIVHLTRKLKGEDGVLLVTDAMRATRLSNGVYDLGGQSMRVEGGVARTEGGNLAGSTLTLTEAAFNYQRFAEVSLEEAVRAASLRPARAIGLFDRGALEPGFLADVLLVDSHGQNRLTMRRGQVVYDGR